MIKKILFLAFNFLFLKNFILAEYKNKLKNEEKLNKQFKDFKTKFNKKYQTSEEENLRKKTFEENLKKIEKLQAKSNEKLKTNKDSATYGVTIFADLSLEEFRHRYFGLNTELAKQQDKNLRKDLTSNSDNQNVLNNLSNLKNEEPLPTKLDYRESGCVSDPLMSQGQCGSCWSFSAMYVVESCHAAKNGICIDYSKQQPVDCIRKCSGCNGGYPLYVLEHAKLTGIALDTDYPYLARKGKCRAKGKKFSPAVYVKTYGELSNLDENTVMKRALVDLGVGSIAMNANTLQFYTGGVLDDDASKCPPNELNHAVTLVGYNSESGKNYWIVKNSWGTKWGINGYFHVKIGSNVCGIKAYYWWVTC